MFNFKSWFKPKPNPELAKEQIKQIDATVPPKKFDISPSDIAMAMHKSKQSTNHQITQMMSSGKVGQSNKVGGNDYPPNWVSEKRRARRLEQIRKGIIQVTEDKPQAVQSTEAT